MDRCGELLVSFILMFVLDVDLWWHWISTWSANSGFMMCICGFYVCVFILFMLLVYWHTGYSAELYRCITGREQIPSLSKEEALLTPRSCLARNPSVATGYSNKVLVKLCCGSDTESYLCSRGHTGTQRDLLNYSVNHPTSTSIPISLLHLQLQEMHPIQ